jgi:carboxylesterase type B
MPASQARRKKRSAPTFLGASATRSVTRCIAGRGWVKGTSFLAASSTHVKAYRFSSIPYVTPLTAAQRWRRALPLPAEYRYGESSATAYDATGPNPECPQPKGYASRPSEDCLRCVIWLPGSRVRRRPAEGWPVFVYLHGGFLQWGSPNLESAVEVLGEGVLEAVVVLPGYRLNGFGFLCGKEFGDGAAEGEGNVGFWDQRMAVEWVGREIARWGGDPRNITLGGLSAGAYSTFHQLAYEVGLEDGSEILIRRVVMWSNGCGLQPKSVGEVQGHFDALVAELGIDTSLPAAEKLAVMRSKSWQAILAAVEAVPENSFRAVTDAQFIRPTLVAEILSGAFARTMARRGVKILMGDLPEEPNVYKLVSPPASYEGLYCRLAVEYPEAACAKLVKMYCPSRQPPPGQSWQDIFGTIYTDMQVYVTERGLVEALAQHLPVSAICRYRINWRPKCVDDFTPPSMGVTHGTDLAIWWFGRGFASRTGLAEAEKEVVREFLRPYGEFVAGREVHWGTGNVREVRTLLAGGQGVAVTRDEFWERGLAIWHALQAERLSRL